MNSKEGSSEGVSNIPGPVKKPVLLASYAGGPVTLHLGEKTIVVRDVVRAEVYYYAEQDRRTWVWIQTKSDGGGDYLLGTDDTVHFSTPRSWSP